MGRVSDVLTAADARHWALLTRAALAARRTEIDALNVFPVPDGDTGTNLYLTLDAAIDEVVAVHEKAGILGREIECAVLDGHGTVAPRASLPGEIVVVEQSGDHQFYDFEAKYQDDDAAQLSCPAELPEDENYDTLSGLVLDRLGRTAVEGDSVLVTWRSRDTDGNELVHQARIDVISTQRHVPDTVALHPAVTLPASEWERLDDAEREALGTDETMVIATPDSAAAQSQESLR